ncbi:MAG: TIGR00730 family Rossman fold protein [Saprospiraceae bacterium]
MKFKSILVFCGSKTGNHPIYESIACQLGIALAERNINVIYGGGDVGLMGVLADATLRAGGTVTGIIPYFLSEREGGRTDLTELIEVDSMAERKKLMAKRSDAIITLPGGYGTLDELFEMLTLVQLSQANHPIGILNVNGYFNHLIAQIKVMEKEGLLSSTHRNLLLISDKIDDLLLQMEQNLD